MTFPATTAFFAPAYRPGLPCCCSSHSTEDGGGAHGIVQALPIVLPVRGD